MVNMCNIHFINVTKTQILVCLWKRLLFRYLTAETKQFRKLCFTHCFPERELQKIQNNLYGGFPKEKWH